MKAQRGFTLIVYAVLALAILAALGGIGRAIYSAGVDAEKGRWEAAARELRDAEANQANTAATRLEVTHAKAKIIYKTITQTVDKYIDRPVYRNICFDADGLRDANAALAGALTPATEPDQPVPASRSAYRWEWRLRLAQNHRGG